jgi:hypothetical protein
MILIGLAFATVACASTSGAGGESTLDMRGSTAVASAEPALLLAGPARLLHVNADRRMGVTLYRVSRHEGTSADCRAVRQEAVIDWDRESDLLVRKDETICVSAARATHLSWHARPASGDLVEIRQAKN